MTSPQDAIPDPVRSSDYWTGYYQGKDAAMRNIGTIRRTELVAARTARRRDGWVTAWFWLLVVLVAASNITGWLVHNYSRVDAFQDGIMLTLALGRVTRLRYPR